MKSKDYYEEDMGLENAEEYIDVSTKQATGYFKDNVGDRIVRNNVPNYSPNSNSQNRYLHEKFTINRLDTK